jgi:FKBP-type peptidyl-prolyl cis-trans isomerase FkpA
MRLPVLILLLACASPAFAAPQDDALSEAANTSFLAANAARPGVVSKPDGLQYRILTPGFGKRPGPNDTVQIVYSGRLIDGKLFDGASPGLPATVPVSNLIKGINEALQLMHVGERWQVVMPASLAYGAAGAANGAIPPGQALVFDITLVSVLDAGAAPSAAPGVGFGISSSSQGIDRRAGAFLSFPQ